MRAPILDVLLYAFIIAVAAVVLLPLAVWLFGKAYKLWRRLLLWAYADASGEAEARRAVAESRRREEEELARFAEELRTGDVKEREETHT